jgi:hypothetical protein
MQKDHTFLNKIFGAVAFFGSLLIYFLTMPLTTAFWDSPEWTATAYLLQIPHPPGAPFFLLIGRLFSMFVPAEYVALSMNVYSAIASAGTILFLYLIIVRFIMEMKGHPDSYNPIDKVALYGGALIGALAFSVTDSFWISAVEAETYALSMFFTSLVVWLVLKWSDRHDQPGNERWLIFIVYVFGLAFGVHLLSLLALFAIAMVIYFKKYEFTILSFVVAGTASIGAFFLIYPITAIQLPTLMGSLSDATGGLIGAGLFFLSIFGLIVTGIYYTQKKRMRVLNMFLLAYGCILLGYSTYTLIIVRSMANPPIDQNSPDSVRDIVSYLNREQYGSTPLISGNTFNNETGTIDRNKESLFPRRYSREASHVQKYAQYDSDLHFFWQYQLNHMYFRYFAWNFIGRDSDVQDAHWVSGFTKTDSTGTPAHNVYFYLPFLVGLIGMFFHFQSDWKRATVVMVLFVVTGIAIVAYLNQFPFQPRERDYSYTGSFMAFAIWIGIGSFAMIQLLGQFAKSRAIALTTAALLFLAVPVWMGYQNWDDHDRTLQYVAPDYAYNLLNSVAPYAIIFTNGDNDTFPLWYLQDVEGVRRDVRVVNLSLLNTTWYIKQMKNKWNYEAPPVPMSITDEQVDRIEEKFQFTRPDHFWRPQEVVIPVNKNKLANLVEQNPNVGFEVPLDQLDDDVRFYYEGNFLAQDQQGNSMYYTRVQDDMVLDIIRTNQWERPIYYAITVSSDGQLNMQPYFRLEGKAFRIVPQRHSDPYGAVNPIIHGDRLRGFRFREIGNEDAYFDENIRRMMDNYRTVITRQAQEWARVGQLDSARVWLQWGEENIPFTTIRGDLTSMVTYAYRYSQFGDNERAVELAKKAIPDIQTSLRSNMSRVDAQETQMTELDAQLQANRTDASKRREISNRIRSISTQRETLIREISFDSSRFMIVQHILFQAGLNDDALAIATLVSEMTSQRIPFPTTAIETKMNVDRIMGD